MLTLLAFFAAMLILQITVAWHMVVAAVVISFLVWTIAEKECDWVHKLWGRYKKGLPKEIAKK